MTTPEKKSKNGKTKDEKIEKKKENNMAIGCCVAVFIILIVSIVILFRTSSSTTTQSPSTQESTTDADRYMPGRETKLKEAKTLYIGTTKENWNKLYNYISAEDSIGTVEMVLNGEALEVDGGSQIKVIKSNVNWSTGRWIIHIRVQEGRNAFSEGWIDDIFLE